MIKIINLIINMNIKIFLILLKEYNIKNELLK